MDSTLDFLTALIVEKDVLIAEKMKLMVISGALNVLQDLLMVDNVSVLALPHLFKEIECALMRLQKTTDNNS